GKMKRAVFQRGELVEESDELPTEEKHGTKITFTPDNEIFKEFRFRSEHVERLVRNYCYLNRGLNIHFNGERYYSENGLLDLLQENLSQEPLYPIVHLADEDIEIAFTHTEEYSEEYYSFVNGQHTTQGGTHLGAFRESLVRVVKDFFKKEYEATDVRRSLAAAVSVKIVDPVFESQTKTKLGSTEIEPDGKSIRAFVMDFLKERLDNYLHRNPETADAIQEKVQRSEKERKEMAGIRKLARKRAKQASIHNKKLKDCKIHLNDKKEDERKKESTIFLTEGDSASGSITKARDVNTQAVFSLKGKPLNAYGLSKKAVYENEEFNLIQAALNIEESLDDLRYNRIILATDADVDGMHIRLLLLTFFLQFFPELVKREHVHILETPLYRVRNKKATHYCYNEEERRDAIQKLGGQPEITRFKGLGEISPDEFKEFIRPDKIRTEPVILNKDSRIPDILEFYMGKNTPDRQNFIVENLRVDKDLVDEKMAKGEK
ncbi:MAG: toprim domain-containing protein, partial [Flavobacteriales bacterium]